MPLFLALRNGKLNQLGGGVMALVVSDQTCPLEATTLPTEASPRALPAASALLGTLGAAAARGLCRTSWPTRGPADTHREMSVVCHPTVPVWLPCPGPYFMELRESVYVASLGVGVTSSPVTPLSTSDQIRSQ